MVYTDQLSSLLQLKFQSIIMVNVLAYSIIYLPNDSLKNCLMMCWYFIEALFNLFDLIFRLSKKFVYKSVLLNKKTKTFGRH